MPIKHKEKGKDAIIKADRTILQRLITAYRAGRNDDMQMVMQHELLPVPVSLAEMNVQLRTGAKSLLADVVTAGINCSDSTEVEGTSCLIIDGNALVISIGKPSGAKTFGDLADTFKGVALHHGRACQQIHITFDRYRTSSIKSATRQKRTVKRHPIRRVIEGRDVPLPQNWDNFLALPENKADLARFLSKDLIHGAPPDKLIIVGGGFEDEQEVGCSSADVDVSSLRASHEEADTRMILHALNVDVDTLIVLVRDTDVLLMLLAHSPVITCKNIWMMAGTAKKRKYIPIRAVVDQMPPGSLPALLPFHAITGCDSTSYISGHTKKSAWSAFKTHHKLLSGLGENPLTEQKINDAEKFMCRLYNVSDSVSTTNEARLLLFGKLGSPEALPPTSDALRHHIKRTHYQSMVWKLANVPVPHLPQTDTMGWSLTDGKLIPILMTNDPVPKACMEIISCHCMKGCGTMHCKCRQNTLVCTGACKCRLHEDLIKCMNIDND